MDTLADGAWAYWTDSLQRAVLTADVLRLRGNRFVEHSRAGSPPVLVFEHEPVLYAERFERPCNHGLLRTDLESPAAAQAEPAGSKVAPLRPQQGRQGG